LLGSFDGCLPLGILLCLSFFALLLPLLLGFGAAVLFLATLLLLGGSSLAFNLSLRIALPLCLSFLLLLSLSSELQGLGSPV
jgi:hypothetical protein